MSDTDVVVTQPDPSRGGRHRRTAVAVETEPRPDRGPRAPGRLDAALCLLALLAAVACVAFAAATPSASRSGTLTGTTSQAAQSAARAAVQQILSYDYRQLDADVARAKADATGVFAQQYAGTASTLLSKAKQERAIVQATIGSSGVVSAGPGNVVVLLFVDQATVRKPIGQKTPATRIDQNRVRVTMTRVHGRWLVSQLEAL